MIMTTSANKTIATLLDNLHIGCRVFDVEDQTLLRDHSMLVYFRSTPGTFRLARPTVQSFKDFTNIV